MFDLATRDIKFISGVGPQKAAVLNKELEIYSLHDLIYYFLILLTTYNCRYHLRLLFWRELHFMRKKIEMSLINSPANGVVIKRIISDGLKEIVSLKEQILLETTAKIQSIEEKREEKVIQGYYDGYAKGIIDVMDNFIPLISLLSSELEKNRINMINDLKSILLKSSEEVEVFIKIFESWVTKLPSISGPLNLYIPTSFKDKSIEVESYFVDKSIWNVHISYHDDKRFVFFTDQFIAEFSPQEFVDNCEQYLISNHCFSPDKVNEICEHARHYLVERMCEIDSLAMNNSDLTTPEDL